MPRTASAAPSEPTGASPVGEALGLGRVGSREWGYRTSDVDALLAPLVTPDERAAADDGGSASRPDPRDLRGAVFRRQRGGYAPADVDAAVDRLEDEAAAARMRDFVREHGQQAWNDRVDEQLDAILGRLARPAGRRFRAPSSDSVRGYSAGDVDELCDRLQRQLHSHELPRIPEVRAAVFGAAWGDDVYEEHQVDAFLEAVVDLVRSLD